jgi:hypothetical protein
MAVSFIGGGNRMRRLCQVDKLEYDPFVLFEQSTVFSINLRGRHGRDSMVVGLTLKL